MGLASHLGPWLLGTVKDTTGTTSGTIRNMGATVAAQSKAVAFGDSTATQAFVLPAGALITGMQIITTTAFTATAVITLSIGATAISTASAIVTAGSNAVAVDATAGAAALIANVGTTDAIVTYTVTGTSIVAGAGILVVQYIVRLSDGSYAPTAYTA